jgi:hypothetical protein
MPFQGEATIAAGTEGGALGYYGSSFFGLHTSDATPTAVPRYYDSSPSGYIPGPQPHPLWIGNQ